MSNIKKALSIALFMIIVSCGEEKKEANSNAIETPLVYNSVYENPAYTEVYNEYVTYLNDITSSYDTAYDYYFSAFPQEFPNELKSKPSLVTISDYPDDHLERALAADLNIETLEKPALNVKNSIVIIRQLMLQADGYYERQEYLDDNAEQGRTLHDSIVPAFNNLDDVVTEFHDQIMAIEEDMQQVELKRYKKEDLMIRYYCLNILTTAREVNKFTQVETMEDFAALDVAKVIDVRKRLIENIQNLEKVATEEQFNKEFGTIGTAKSSYDFAFKSASNQLIVHLRKLEERLKNNDFEPVISANTPSGIKNMMIKQYYKGKGLPEGISDTMGNLIDGYNDIID